MGATKRRKTAGAQSEALPKDISNAAVESSGDAAAERRRDTSKGTSKKKSPEKYHPSKRPLTEAQHAFVAAILSGQTLQDAARTAGYSAKGAAHRASVLMRTPAVAEAIASGRAKVLKKFEVKAEQVIEELAKVAFDQEVSPIKVRALELLGKHLQLFVERVDMRVDAMRPEERAARATALLTVARERLLGGGDE